jgi:hypothetical protein
VVGILVEDKAIFSVTLFLANQTPKAEQANQMQTVGGEAGTTNVLGDLQNIFGACRHRPSRRLDVKRCPVFLVTPETALTRFHESTALKDREVFPAAKPPKIRYEVA